MFHGRIFCSLCLFIAFALFSQSISAVRAETVPRPFYLAPANSIDSIDALPAEDEPPVMVLTAMKYYQCPRKLFTSNEFTAEEGWAKLEESEERSPEEIVKYTAILSKASPEEKFLTPKAFSPGFVRYMEQEEAQMLVSQINENTDSTCLSRPQIMSIPEQVAMILVGNPETGFMHELTAFLREEGSIELKSFYIRSQFQRNKTVLLQPFPHFIINYTETSLTIPENQVAVLVFPSTSNDDMVTCMIFHSRIVPNERTQISQNDEHLSNRYRY